MRNLHTKWLSLGLACLMAGCSQCGQLFSKHDKEAEKPPAKEAADEKPRERAPYVLNAEASGRCINFGITNTGPADLPLKASDFALIPKGTRRVVPYAPSGAAIEFQKASAKPGETVRGRAVFNDFADPAGDKLVFKPDGIGTFTFVRAAGTGPVLPGSPVALLPPAEESRPKR